MRCVAIGALLASLLGTTTAVDAENWMVSWEGNDYPENDGWQRDLWGPGDTRTLHDGVMTLDTRATIEMWDGYIMHRSLSLLPGETLFVDWRVRVDDVTFDIDPGVWLKTDNYRGADFLLAIDHVELADFTVVGQFLPGVFHEFGFRTSDLATYQFFIDGVLSYEGSLYSSAYSSKLGWGDVVYGSSSLADWDYLRFGVLPEPAAGSSLLVSLLLLRGFTRGCSLRR